MSNRPGDAVWVDEWTDDMIDASKPEPDGTDLRWSPTEQWVHLAAGRLGIWAAAEVAVDRGEDSDYARAVMENRERWLVQDGQLDPEWEHPSLWHEVVAAEGTTWVTSGFLHWWTWRDADRYDIV